MRIFAFCLILSLIFVSFSFGGEPCDLVSPKEAGFSWFSAIASDDVAETMFREAQSLAAAGKPDKAAVIFGRLASLSPTRSQAAYLEVARCHIANDDSRKAFQWLKVYHQKYGECGQSMYLLGSAFALNEDYEKAVPAYESSISLKSDDPEVHLALSLANDRLGRFNKVIEHAQKAVQLDPSYKKRLQPIVRNSNLSRSVGAIVDEVLRETEDSQLSDEQINAFAKRVGEILGEEKQKHSGEEKRPDTLK